MKNEQAKNGVKQKLFDKPHWISSVYWKAREGFERE